MEEKVQQRVYIDFCFRLGKTGAETSEMLQVAFGDSCLSRSKTFEWYSHFKVDADPLKMTPAQAGLPPPTPRRPWHVREIIHADWRLTIREVAEEVRIAFSTCQKILTRFANETCESEICAPSPNGGTEGRSHVNLHWPPRSSPKRSQLHVLGNHWWRTLGLRVWPGNKANVLPVEHIIISSTEKSAAGEVQYQDHVDCVLRQWQAGSSWVFPYRTDGK